MNSDSQCSSRSSMGSFNRKLKLRALLEDLSAIDDAAQDNVESINKTTKVVQETKSLLLDGTDTERARHPGEGFLDSKVLLTTSGLVIRYSEAVSGNVNSYDKDVLSTHVRENPEFWDFLLPRTVPVYSYLFGTFEPTPPEELPSKPRKKIEKQQRSDIKEPENVEKLEKVEEGSEMVSRAHKHISRMYKKSNNKPVSYFHTVLDPTSFATTIENIYHISFLVRDGLISVQLDEESGLPFIVPFVWSQKEKEGRALSEENQFIVSMDMDRWKRFIHAFNITRPAMQLKK